MARDVLALLDDMEIDRADMMGHALGGIIGLALARTAPERLGKLVVVNGWATTDPVTLRCFAARLYILKAGGPKAYLDAQPIFLFPAAWISDNGERLARETEGHLAHFQGEEALRKRIAAIAAFDATTWIGSLTTPTLALASRDDMLAPYTASERLAAANHHISLSLMPWGGHACNVTDPDTFDRIVLDFQAGYGFAGIAVALMGRNHPLGVLLAALLFGALQQGGAELAFEIPSITREMVVVIQGLIILFNVNQVSLSGQPLNIDD